MSFNKNNKNSLTLIGEVGYMHDCQMHQKELQCLKLYFLEQNILNTKCCIFKVFCKKKRNNYMSVNCKGGNMIWHLLRSRQGK